MDLVATLPFLFLAACPAMMVLCMVGMRKLGCSARPDPTQQVSPRSREERVTALEGQLTAIQAELLALRAQGDQHLPGEEPDVARPGASARREVPHATRQPA